MHAQTAMIENVFTCPRKPGWLPKYLHELPVFPNGKHDDRVDLTSQLARLTQAGRPRAPQHLPVLQGARLGAADRPARAIIGDGEAAAPPPLVTRRQHDHIAEECRGLEVRRALSAFRPLRTGSRQIHHYSFTRCAFIASARKPVKRSSTVSSKGRRLAHWLRPLRIVAGCCSKTP